MPVASLGGATMTNWLKDHSAKYGVPREIVLDHGSDMESKEFTEYCDSLGIKRRYTTPYHHQSNLVERTNRTILNLLRVALDEKDGWVDKISSVLLAYRVSVHSSSGVSPFIALYGFTPRLPLDLRFPTDLGNQRVVAELHERFQQVRKKVREKQSVAAKKRGDDYDAARKVKERTLKVGSRVYWKKEKVGKLDAQWSGPFDVVEVGDVNVLIRGQGPVTKLVHMNYLKVCDSPAPLDTLRQRGRPRKN